MKYCIFILFALAACSSKSKQGAGQEFQLPPPVSVPTAVLADGSKIAQQGTTNGAAACIACHGANGEGQVTSGFPRLAGQSQMYLSTQLQAFRSGARENAVMSPIAKALSEQESHNVAAYYESLTNVPYARAVTLKGARAKRALQLTTFGDSKLGLQSCQNCHGPGGIGEGPSIPYLKGQFASYTSAQLKAWKDGSRKTNPEHMGYISKLIPDADIAILAAYFQQVPALEPKK